MALIPKNDVNQIFGSQAPDQDKPAQFNNYTGGWDASRINNGKPTIKQFNYLQQRTDQNILYIHQNGGALPYDSTIEYAENATVLIDGELKQKKGDQWVSIGAKSDSDIITWSGKTQEKRNSNIVYASDFKFTYDTSDETVKLLALLKKGAGKEIIFDEVGDIYYSARSEVISIFENTRVYASNVRFIEIESAGDYRWLIEGGVKIDRLDIKSYPSENNRGVRITKGGVHIGIYKNTPDSNTGWNNLRRRSLCIGFESGESISDIFIGKIEVRNWDYPLMAHNVKNLTINSFDIQAYRQCAWLSNVSFSEFNNGNIRETSINSTGTAGENGILVESTFHHGSQHLFFNNLHVQDSGEHGFRLGGAYITNDIWYIGCTTKNTGVGVLVNHGGSGFKALGSTITNTSNPLVYTSTHKNINYINCTTYDVTPRTNEPTEFEGDNNFDGFNLGRIDGFSLIDCSVRRTSKDYYSQDFTPRDFSCENGVAIVGCINGTISNLTCENPKYYSIYIFDVENTTSSYWGTSTEDISIVGGSSKSAGKAGIGFFNKTHAIRRFICSDFSVFSSPFASREDGINGAISGCKLGGTNLYTNTYNVKNISTTTIDLWGTFIGDNLCKNGSKFTNETTGDIRIRKANTWVTL